MSLTADGSGAPQRPPDPPVETIKKNIEVLRGLPSSQLIPVMAVIANSLGVTCAYCHTEEWESDEKPSKETARRMLRMTFAMNGDFYGGKVVVTCNTCHRGALRPEGTPRLEEAGWKRRRPAAMPAAEPSPSLEQVIERYVSFLGGRDRVRRIRGRRAEGVVARDSGRASASGRFEIEQEKPDRVRAKSDLSYPPEANRWLARLFFLDLDSRDLRGRLSVAGRDTIDGEEMIVVELAGPDDRRERLEFGARRGDLRRIRSELSTPVGPLPEQYDLQDYRKVNGVRVPHTMEWSRGDYHVIHRLTRVGQTLGP